MTLIPNNGDGTFGATRIVGSTWRSPWSVASADFNADGRMDLAVAEPGGYMLSIFLNNADGSFTASSYEASPTGDPCAVTTGDFIGDAMPDVAMAAGKYSSFSVFRNLNKAIFFWRYDFSAGYKHDAIAAADFNGDGKADLVLTNNFGESIGDPPSLDSVSVLINDGAGNFAETTYVIGYNPYSVAAGDLNGDGKPDLAVATFGHSTAPSTVSVLLNNGDGTFAERTEYHTGQSPRSVCAADFDGDGKLDLATANSTHNTVSVLLNHGNGAFPSRIDYAVGEEPYSVTSADFNADGKPDLAVANYADGNVSILLNTTQAVVKVTVDQAATQPDPAAASPIHFTAVFSNPVTGFTGQDVILGGTAGATTAIVTGTGDTYDIAVSGMTRSGTVTVSIPGNAAQNAAGVWNVPSTSTDQTILFDPPFALMTPPAPGASVARNQSYRIQWIGGAPGASLQIWRRSAKESVRLVDAVPAQQGYYDWNTAGVADGWYCFGAWVNPGDGGKWYYAASPGWLHVVNQAPSITFATPAVPSAINQGQPFAINWQASDPNGDPLHVALWAYSKDTGWFALPGAEWLDAAIGTYVWSTSNAKPGWYCFAGNLWDGSATATGKSPNWLQVIAQKPTFAFLTPTKGQKTSFGSTFSIQWQATVPQQYQNQTKVELWACYLDWKDNNKPVWQRIAANLDPAAGTYSWNTSNLNRNYHWYSFAAWIGYGSVWVNVASQHWLQIV